MSYLSIAGWTVFMCYINSLNWNGSTILFVVKKCIDCFIAAVIYIVVIFTHYFGIKYTVNINQINSVVLNIIVFIIVLALQLKLLFLLIRFLGNIARREHINGAIFVSSLTSIFILILFTCTSINYLTYVLFPNAFFINSEYTFAEVSFEFIYYTFLLLVNSSSSSIIAITFLSKALQMIQIFISYAFICTTISIIVSRIINKEAVP